MTTQPTHSERPATPPLPRKAAPSSEPAASPDARFHIGDLCTLLESYLSAPEVAEVYRAYLFSAEAHEGQHRRSGEPYIFHPIEVARILAHMHLDGKSISAAILHDVIEDTRHGKDSIAELFGKDVAELVDGVSKIDKIEFRTEEEEQAENFRKMLLAMSQDIRVILIKLADRLHNMRTLASLRPERRRAIARETIEIYAPIANRLGMRKWAHELEDQAFGHLYPMRYRVLAEAMRKRLGNRKAIVEKVRAAIQAQLAKDDLPADVSGREKSLYAIYRKMHDKSLPFEQVYDVYAFRIVTDRVDTCYRILGVVHNLYKPIPGRFKDYIAIPKTNGYQSLHTVVFGPFGLSIEVQIRTREMHRVAEAGVAAHWLYKSSEPGGSDAGQQHALTWLHDLLEIQSEAGNANEFLDHLKIDLFPDEIYVFTPNGDIRKLPRGATVIDFAYDVHTDIGNRCVGAKVSHVLVPLRTVLRNGDHVEVLTSKWGRPSPSWLDYVVTSKARAHIRQFLKNLQRGESVSLGERLLEKALADVQVSLAVVNEGQKNEILRNLKLKTWDDLLADIGLGNRLATVVALQLQPAAHAGSAPAKEAASDLAIRGTEGVVVTYARCCRPIPGDPILGFLSAGRGITVHTPDCPNVAKFRKHPEQWIDVHWEEHIEGVFPVNVRVEVKNQRGVLAQVAAVIAELDANIDTVSIEERDGLNSAIDFTVEVRDRVHLAAILRRLRALEPVIRINRMKG
jgi:GTP diphosphokinase / guanosine-3',5'-bis(diphosphate) 3'-diphosphatase